MELAGCVIVTENKILLLHRASKNWYELPGGKIEDGETPEEAARREMKEELGCDVAIKHLIGEKSFEEKGRLGCYIWFRAQMETEQIVLGESVHDHFAFIPLQELRQIRLSPNMKNLCEEIEKGKITV